MTGDGLNGQSAKKKNKRRQDPGAAVKDESRPFSMSLFRSGEWLPPEELHANALAAAQAATDITLDLSEVDHLDARALQILLALAHDRQEKGRALHLVNASPVLRQWFEYAGTSSYLSTQSSGRP
jgi:anti-anti-sigma factor